MTTLHRYILRELLKTFALTLLGSTALFVLAGGLLNIVTREGLGTEAMMFFIPYLTPIAVTLMMPVSAIFAATIVYGRIAADNELTACRAAGINIHRLFASALLLAVGVSAFVLVSGNYVMPLMESTLRSFARENIRALAEQQIKTRGRVAYTDDDTQLYLTAARTQSNFEPAGLEARGWNPDLEYISLEDAVLLQLDGSGELVRFAAAEVGMIQFDTRADPVEITAVVVDAMSFDRDGPKGYVDNQAFGPIPVALPELNKVSFLNLHRLMEVQARPWTFRPIAQLYERYRMQLAVERFKQRVTARIAAGEPVVLLDARGVSHELTAAEARAAAGASVALVDVRLVWPETDPARPSRITAPAAELALTLEPEGMDAAEETTPDPRPRLTLEFRQVDDEPVRVDHPGSGQFLTARERDAERVEELAPAPTTTAALLALTPQEALDADWQPNIAVPRLGELRDKLQMEAGAVVREIYALYNFRFGSAFSVVVIVVMGAALGIVFRGGRALSAFGLSSIPLAITTILLVMGKQTTEREGMVVFGISVIWAGLLAVAIADLVILRVGVRR